MGEFKIKFKFMTDDDFNKFREFSIISYSRGLVQAGLYSIENAYIHSKIEFDELLPLGNHTQNHFLYLIENIENEELGHLWFEKKLEGSIVFICDFLILEKFRNKGYGKQSLLLFEDVAKEKGFKKIALHVFRYNDNAISLYMSLGYKILKKESESMYLIKDI